MIAFLLGYAFGRWVVWMQDRVLRRKLEGAYARELKLACQASRAGQGQ